MEQLRALPGPWWTPSWPLVAGSSVMLLAANVFSGVIWGRMVRDLSGHRLSPGSAAQVFLLANLGRYVPGKIWQVAGLAVLARRRGVPAGVATTAAVLGHAFSLGAATLVGGLVFARIEIGPAIPGWTVPVAVAVLLLIALAPPVLRLAVRSVRRWLPAGDEPPRVTSGHAAIWVTMFLGIWVFYGASFSAFAAGFSIEAPPTVVASAFVAAYVLGYVAVFAPAGIGVREVALAGLLSPSTGPAAATGLAVVARLWVTAVEVVPGAFLWSREVTTPSGPTQSEPEVRP